MSEETAIKDSGVKPIKTTEIEQYISESVGLERDFIGEILASRLAAWRVVGLLGLLAILALGCAVAAFYRQVPPPLVLRVDNATGSVDLVTTMRESQKSYGEIVDIYWLNKYILNRESYDYHSIQMLYETTALLSTEQVQKEYYAIYQGAEARDKVLRDEKKIIVIIRSIVPTVKGGKAIVRFSTHHQNQDGHKSDSKDLIATVTYKYTNSPMKTEDRRINPLGFQVTSYRVDPELISR